MPALHRAREVEVVVDEARHDGGAGQFDRLRAGPGAPRHLGTRAARDDAAVVDRERFDDREIRIDGDDLAVRDHRVDGLRGSRARGQRRGRESRPRKPPSGAAAHLRQRRTPLRSHGVAAAARIATTSAAVSIGFGK